MPWVIYFGLIGWLAWRNAKRAKIEAAFDLGLDEL